MQYDPASPTKSTDDNANNDNETVDCFLEDTLIALRNEDKHNKDTTINLDTSDNTNTDEETPYIFLEHTKVVIYDEDEIEENTAKNTMINKTTQHKPDTSDSADSVDSLLKTDNDDEHEHLHNDNAENSSNSTDTSDDDTPKLNPIRYLRIDGKRSIDRSYRPRSPENTLNKYPFGAPKTNIEHTVHSKGPGGELRSVEPVQTADPEHRLTAAFNPNDTRYVDSNPHFQQHVLRNRDDEFVDEFRNHKTDRQGLPYRNLLGEQGQLLTRTFLNAVNDHEGMPIVPRNFKPRSTSTPLPTIPGSPTTTSQTFQFPEPIDTHFVSQTVPASVTTNANNGSKTSATYANFHGLQKSLPSTSSSVPPPTPSSLILPTPTTSPLTQVPDHPPVYDIPLPAPVPTLPTVPCLLYTSPSPRD